MTQITLAPYRETDRAALSELLISKQIGETFMLPDFSTAAALQAMVDKLMAASRSPAHYERGIYADGALVGFLNDVDIDGRRMELGYVIHPEHQGKGYATRALRLAMNELFRLGYDTVETGAFVENTASRRVMEKCGMTLTDRRERIAYHGREWDCVYYVLRADTTLRLMTAEDYDAAYALWRSCAGMGLNDRDDSKEGIGRYLTRNPATCFVAEKDGRMVGVILAGHDGRRGYIYHMAVATDCRRRGIGARLVQAVLAAFKGEGIHKAALVVFSANETGNAFWARMGFTAREDLTYRNLALAKLERIDT